MHNGINYMVYLPQPQITNLGMLLDVPVHLYKIMYM